MAFCFNCGTEVIVTEKYNNIAFVICESCGHEFSVRDYGVVSQKKLGKAKKTFRKNSPLNNKIDMK